MLKNIRLRYDNSRIPIWSFFVIKEILFSPDVGTINPFPEITCRSDKELLAWREYLKQEKIDFNSKIKFEVKKMKKYTIVKIKLVKSSDFIGYGELWVRENFLK